MSKANDSVTEIKVKKIALGISIFIFLGTLPYWLVDRNSNLSIINMIFGKVMGQIGEVEIDAEATLALNWAKFYFHLIITSIGLLIYFFSNTSKYIGYALSRFYMGKFFHGNSKAMNKTTRLLKMIITPVFIVTVYLLVMGLIEADKLPISSYNYTMLMFFLLSVTWSLGYPEFIENPNLSGEYDFRNKLMLVKLNSNQIAYYRLSVGRDEWKLIPSGSDADFSYQQVFVIPISKLNHKINGVTFIKTKIGSIIGDIEIRPKKKSKHSTFPTLLNTHQISYLNSITNEDNFLSDVNFSSKESTLKKEIAQYYQLLDSFFTNNPTSSPESWNAEYLKTTKAINELEFEQNLSKTIENEIHNIIGVEGIFEVAIIIEEENEGPRRHIDEKIQKHYTDWSIKYGAVINGRIDKIVDALTNQIGTVGISEDKIDNLINKATNISNNMGNNDKVIELSKDEVKILPDKSEKERFNQLIEIINTCQNKTQTKEDSIEQISESDFFNHMSSNDVDAFIKKILSDWDIENEKKTVDAIKTMVLEIIHFS